MIEDYCFIRTILLHCISYRHRNACLSPIRKCRKSSGTLFCLRWSWRNVRTLVHGNYKYIFRFKSRYLPSGTTISFYFNASHFVKKAEITSKAGATHTSDTCLCFMPPITCQLFLFPTLISEFLSILSYHLLSGDRYSYRV